MLKRQWLYHQTSLISLNLIKFYPIQRYIKYVLTIWQEQLKRNFIVLLIIFKLSLINNVNNLLPRMHYKKSNTKRIWKLIYMDTNLQAFYSTFYIQIPWYLLQKQRYIICNEKNSTLGYEITYQQLTQSLVLSVTAEILEWYIDLLREALLIFQVEIITLNRFDLELIIRSQLKFNA